MRGGLSPLSLSIYRFLLGTIWFFVLLYRLPEISAFYFDSGVLPLNDAFKLVGEHRLSLLFLSPSEIWVWFVYGVGLIAALGLALGAYANVSAFISWIVCISLMNRNEMLVSGTDLYLSAFLFATTFMHVDSRFALKPSKLLARTFSFGHAYFLAQVIVLYFFTGAIKNGELWRQGEALHTILEVKLTTRDLGRWLLQFPLLLKLGTYAIPLLEMSAIVLLFKRARRYWLPLAFVMHVGVAIAMNHLFLPFLSMAVLIALWPSDESADQKSRAAWVASFVLVLINVNSTLVPIFPSVVVRMTEAIRFDQQWNFYGPNPSPYNQWFTILSEPKWPRMKETTDLEPEDPASLFENKNWAVYFLSLGYPDIKDQQLPVFAKFLCRDTKSKGVVEIQKHLSDVRDGPAAAPYVDPVVRYQCP